jgi:hypothetical protein
VGPGAEAGRRNPEVARAELVNPERSHVSKLLAPCAAPLGRCWPASAKTLTRPCHALASSQYVEAPIWHSGACSLTSTGSAGKRGRRSENTSNTSYMRLSDSASGVQSPHKCSSPGLGWPSSGAIVRTMRKCPPPCHRTDPTGSRCTKDHRLRPGLVRQFHRLGGGGRRGRDTVGQGLGHDLGAGGRDHRQYVVGQPMRPRPAVADHDHRPGVHGT